MKTIANTRYKFSHRTSGKKPEFSGGVNLKRKNKEYSERVLRLWQEQAFKKLFLSKFFLVKAFCGAGKTTLSIVMALHDIIKNNRKQIFIVPQEHIGDGFATNGIFAVPDLGLVHLNSAKNFCEDSEHKVKMLVNFIKSNATEDKDFSYGEDYHVKGSDMIAVCTHSAFNMAMKKIIKQGHFNKLSNIAIYIDEAHHIKGGNDKIEVELEKDFNQLGDIIYKLIENAEKQNLRIGMTTATYFRGDQGIIVKKEFLDKFDRFELDFMEHFETLGIKNVNVNFEEYDDDPIDQLVENIKKEPNERHLIVVPTRSSKWRKKDLELIRLKDALYKMLAEQGVNNPEEVVLDLVTKSTQKQNKAILLREPKEKYDAENTSKIKIVITCMLGREGTDWCACSRLHNTSIELGSTTLAVQTLGRLFRKFHKKTNVAITYYIKKFNELEDSIKKKEFLDDRINAMLCLMLIDDLMHPIILEDLPLSKHTGPKRNFQRKNNKSIKLRDVFQDDFENIKREILELISTRMDFDEETVDCIIQDILSKYNIEDNIEVDGEFIKKENIVNGLKVFLLRARSEILRSKGIDISFIRKSGFNVLVQKHRLRGNFWCGNLNKEKFNEFIKVVGQSFWTKEQIKTMADNIRKVLSCKVKPEYISSEANKIVHDLENIHEAYNEVSKTHSKPLPSKRLVAQKLGLSLEELNQKIKLFNQILPKGYWFFDKNSKLYEKMSLNFAA